MPGPNAKKSKAELLRQFKLPEKFTEVYTSGSPRVIRILAAFVGVEFVWLVVDFARLARLHVISGDEMWKASDFTVGSEVSSESLSISLDLVSLKPSYPVDMA